MFSSDMGGGVLGTLNSHDAGDNDDDDDDDDNDDDDDDDEGSEGVCLGRLAPKQGPILYYGRFQIRANPSHGGVTPSKYIYGDALKLTHTGQIDKYKDKLYKY